MRTFEVSKVELAARPCEQLDRGKAIASLLSVPAEPALAAEAEAMPRWARPPVKRASRIEQAYTSDARLVGCDDSHPLLQMARTAFYEHRPIALSPDAVWFTIAQGFAMHVNLNAEALRHRFVQHEGKQTLVVERADFMLGRPNPWPEAFAAFSAQIGAHVGKLRDLVVADFSTTGPVERAASEVLLMDAFQAYFEYRMRCGCGIPRITLLGTPADWRSVRQRAHHLAEYGLEHWTSVLVPVLDRIVATAEGADETQFWQSFYHYESSSMGSALSGWIHVLFPYLVDWETRQPSGVNPYMDGWQRNFALPLHAWKKTYGPVMGVLPGGLASAPVIVVQGVETHAMRFIAGMFGVVEDTAGVLSPEFGWAIVHDGE